MLIERDILLEDLEAFEDLRDIPPVIVAAMNTNIEIDSVGIGAVVRIGRFSVPFYRHREVPFGEYWIMGEGDWENMQKP